MTTDPDAVPARLLALQDIDSATDHLRHRRAHLPERAALAAIDAERKALAAARRTAEADHAALTARQGELDKGVAQCAAKVADLSRKLKNTSVIREAETMQAEMAAASARQRVLEDEQLDIMEQLEPIESVLADNTTTAAQLAERAAAVHVELAAAEVAVDEELARVVATRPAAAATLEAGLVARYEKLRAKLAGVAVARLVNGHCSGCNLALSSGELDRIRHEPPDETFECEQCGRILVR